MVDLIRVGAAPASMMRRAAQGGLSLPAGEAIEILVSLAGHRELGAEAEQTLENFDQQSLMEAACNEQTSVEVLVYLLQHCTQRPGMMAALYKNPALPLTVLETMASRAGVEVLREMMRSTRLCSSRRLLELMIANSAAEPMRPGLNRLLTVALRNDAEEVATNFLARHAVAVEREEGQPFELVAATVGDDDQLDKLLIRLKRGDTAAAPEEAEQLSLLQRIGRMRVGERIQLAVRGNREERMVLIRDRSRLVSLAVLESPKVNDSEKEIFAAMKNVQEAVLRAISTKRNYIKNYAVLRALVNNPKTPLDAALPLIAHLLVKDYRALAINKNVNETLRKMAMKIYRSKTERKTD
jgi:hypothetical protein